MVFARPFQQRRYARVGQVGQGARTHFSSGVERINTQTLAPPFAEVIDREQNRCGQRKKTLV